MRTVKSFNQPNILHIFFFVNEEDTIKKLDEIVTKLRKFIKIEERTRQIIFTDKNLTIEHKIFFTLVGRYLYNKVKKDGKDELDLTAIGKAIDKPNTSLSLFIQRLLANQFITKASRGKYKVNYYKIEEFMEKIQKQK